MKHTDLENKNWKLKRLTVDNEKLYLDSNFFNLQVTQSSQTSPSLKTGTVQVIE